MMACITLRAFSTPLRVAQLLLKPAEHDWERKTGGQGL
jgi:hypothetical protein